MVSGKSLLVEIGATEAEIEKFRKGSLFLLTKSIPSDEAFILKRRTQSKFDDLVRVYFKTGVNHHFSIGGGNHFFILLDKCVRVALEYFEGSWCKQAEHDCDMRCLDKVEGNFDLRWSEIFRRSMLVTLLTEDLSSARKLAEWVEPSLPADPGDQDPGFAKMLISMASHFCKQPMEGLDAMESAIASSRAKGPRLLLSALRCAREKDQKRFEKIFRESIIHFAKTIGQIFNTESLVYIEGSLLLATARHLGVALPKLEPQLQARIITPETLALGSAKGT